METYKPDAIIHCAAWTAVDAAEAAENRAKVDAINHLGTQYIAEAAKAINGNRCCVYLCLRGNRKRHLGYTFSYENE
jgi:nucleoside-diphosphate-sugar epimerase